MQIWTFSKHHTFKYDFWEKTQYSNMNFWCFLVTPVSGGEDNCDLGALPFFVDHILFRFKRSSDEILNSKILFVKRWRFPHLVLQHITGDGNCRFILFQSLLPAFKMAVVKAEKLQKYMNKRVLLQINQGRKVRNLNLIWMVSPNLTLYMLLGGRRSSRFWLIHEPGH